MVTAKRSSHTHGHTACRQTHSVPVSCEPCGPPLQNTVCTLHSQTQSCVKLRGKHPKSVDGGTEQGKEPGTPPPALPPARMKASFTWWNFGRTNWDHNRRRNSRPQRALTSNATAINTVKLPPRRSGITSQTAHVVRVESTAHAAALHAEFTECYNLVIRGKVVCEA